MTPETWNPGQYQKFAAERAQPFFDLMEMVREVPGGTVIDLGCGTGELTARLHSYTRAATTVGTDSSQAMLTEARPHAREGLRFELGDIRQFGGEQQFDVIFSNAALHWVPDHRRLLRRLAGRLRPDGQLAVQVPANADHPSHAIADELASQAPFVDAIGERTPAHHVLTPERYAELLDDLGFVEQNVRLQVYGHHLASTDDVVEWTKGTTLLRYKPLLPPEQFEAFVACYRDRLIETLGHRSPYFYSFKRILFWARR